MLELIFWGVCTKLFDQSVVSTFLIIILNGNLNAYKLANVHRIMKFVIKIFGLDYGILSVELVSIPSVESVGTVSVESLSTPSVESVSTPNVESI